MVKLDESNIPINWYCPPCDRLENPQKYKNNSTVAATTPVTTTNNGTKGKIYSAEYRIYTAHGVKIQKLIN